MHPNQERSIFNSGKAEGAAYADQWHADGAAWEVVQIRQEARDRSPYRRSIRSRSNGLWVAGFVDGFREKMEWFASQTSTESDDRGSSSYTVWFDLDGNVCRMEPSFSSEEDANSAFNKFYQALLDGLLGGSKSFRIWIERTSVSISREETCFAEPPPS